MKRFLTLLSFALSLVLVAAALSTFASAREDIVLTSSEVLFVSDDYSTGDGSGRDANNPFRPIEHPSFDPDASSPRNYYNSVLYQAAEQLVNTGGTIVVCGPLTLGDAQAYGSGSYSRDVFMPYSDKTLVITSKYDGVDYASTNGAYFMLTEKAHLTMSAPSVWKDITIKTGNTDRAICCGCKTTVFDEGITFVNETGKNTNNAYPTIAGGNRYSSLTGSSDVTVKSGSWYNIVGSFFGISGTGTTVYTQNGDISITITGGTVKNAVYGSVRDVIVNSMANGHINIEVSGGTVPKIYGTGNNAFSNAGKRVNISLSGDTGTTSVLPYVNASSSNFTDNYASTGDPKYIQYPAASYTLDVSGSTMTDSKLHSIISAAGGFDSISYPSSWITSASVLSLPTSDIAFRNEVPSSVGASVSLSFSDPVDETVYNDTVNCTSDSGAFSSVCDTSSEGAVSASYYYGTHKYGEKTVTVVSCPTIFIGGIQLKHDSALTNFEIRFVGYHSKNYNDAVEIDDYGVLAIPTKFLDADSRLNFDQTYGMYEYHSTSDGNVIDVSDGADAKFFVTSSLKVKPSEFNMSFTAVAFVKFTLGGKEYVRYSSPIRRSVYDSASKAAASSFETAEVRAAVASKVLNTADSYDPSYEYLSTTTFRNRVVNYMKSQANVEWSPTSSFWIFNDRKNDSGNSVGVSVKTYFDSSKTYHGIPYTNDHVAQFESFSNTLDANGRYQGSVVPNTGGTTEASMSATDKANGLENYLTFPGSDCSTAVITSWNTVLVNRSELKNLTATYWMVPGYAGTIKVGEYAINDTHYTNEICANNGQQTMFEAYALLRKGDGIVRWNGQGHTRMVTGSVVVNRNGDGTINGATSYIVTTEEANSLYKNTGRSFADSTWRVDKTYYFNDLFSTDYIPITIPELATGIVPGEFTLLTNLDLDNDLAEGRISGNVRSNREIFGVEFIIKNEGGDVVVDQKIFTENMYGIHASDVQLTDFADDFGVLYDSLDNGSYTFSFNAMVSSAPTVALVKDHPFTK